MNSFVKRRGDETGVKGRSRTPIAKTLTVLVDQRKASDKEDKGTQQPQVVQTA